MKRCTRHWRPSADWRSRKLSNCPLFQLPRHLDAIAELGGDYCLTRSYQGCAGIFCTVVLAGPVINAGPPALRQISALMYFVRFGDQRHLIFHSQRPAQRPVFPRVVAFGVLDGLALVTCEHPPGVAVLRRDQLKVQSFGFANGSAQRLAHQVCRLHFYQVGHDATLRPWALIAAVRCSRYFGKMNDSPSTSSNCSQYCSLFMSGCWMTTAWREACHDTHRVWVSA